VEIAFAVVQINQLAIRLVVADHHVQVAVLIDISQRSRVGAIRRTSQIVSREAAFSVVQQHARKQRPVASFSQNEIGIPVAVQIADADARRGFPFLFEQQPTIK
jgi:hypothetical protein